MNSKLAFLLRKNKLVYVSACLFLILTLAGVGFGVDNIIQLNPSLLDSLTDVKWVKLDPGGEDELGSPNLIPAPLKISKNESQLEQVTHLARNHIQQFVSEEFYHKKIKFRRTEILDNPSEDRTKYVVRYLVRLHSTSPKGNKRWSDMAFEVSMDGSGNVIDYNGPKKDYYSIINKEKAWEDALSFDPSLDAEDTRVILTYQNGEYIWKVDNPRLSKSKIIGTLQ